MISEITIVGIYWYI